MTQFSTTKESSYKKELEDSQSAVLNVLDDYRLGAEEISNSRSAILNVLEDHRQGAEDISSSRNAILNVLDDHRQSGEDVSNSRSALLNILEDLELNKTALEQEKASLLAIGDGTFIVDAKGKITFVNKAFEDLLGWKLEEVRERNLIEVIYMEDEGGNKIPYDQRPINIVLRSGTTGTTGTTAFYYVRKDKIRLPVAIIASPIIVNNKIIGAVEIFRDITKENETDRAKTEFVSLASHQLRTPPTSINWFLEMLLNGEAGQLNQKQEEYAREAYQNSRRMVTLINTLLNISRMEAGAFSVSPEPTDIIAFTKDIIEEFKLKIKEKELQVKEQYAPSLPLMQVDPKLLRIAVQNIISNAVKYTPEKGIINVKIFLSQEGETIGDRKLKNNSLVIVITDTGYGIPRNQFDKIFTKLFRADNVKEKDTDGTGLGLYLTKSIVNHAQGDLWFESELNRGTTFYLAVPSKGMERKEGAKELVVGSIE